jgi:hypothetical protein
VRGAAPVIRLVSVLTPGEDLLDAVRPHLEEAFGPPALESGRYPFDRSGYYEKEMGRSLTRVWIAFETLAPAEELPLWKQSCVTIEDRFREGGARRVNLDPGYLDHGKLVLASCKEAPDKIYMGSGVWAHTCLRFRFGAFEAPDHSFPDFRDGRFYDFFMEARRLMKRLQREQGK